MAFSIAYPPLPSPMAFGVPPDYYPMGPLPSPVAFGAPFEHIPNAYPDVLYTKALETHQEPPPERTLGFWDVVMTQTTFATSGGIVTIPFAFGQLGYILGPLLLLLWILLALMVNCLLVDVAMASDRCCLNLGDVGAVLAGWKGRWLFRGMQLLNLVLLLAVVLNLAGSALQYIVDSPWNCIGAWECIVAGILVLLLQVIKVWKAAAWVAYATVLLCVMKTFGFLPYAFAEYQDEVVNASTYMGPAQAFMARQNAWANVGFALATLCFAFTPVFIVIETLAETKKPCQYKKALCTSAAFQAVLYCVPGIVGAAMWGWNIDNPVTLMIPRSWGGILLSVFVFLCSMLDYLIAAIIVNGVLAATPCVASRCTGTGSGIIKHFLVTLPTSLFALLLVCLIPAFNVIVGLITGITVVGMNTFVVTLLWTAGNYFKERYWLHIATVVGLPLAGYIIAASISGIINTDIGTFFCEKVG